MSITRTSLNFHFLLQNEHGCLPAAMSAHLPMVIKFYSGQSALKHPADPVVWDTGQADWIAFRNGTKLVDSLGESSDVDVVACQRLMSLPCNLVRYRSVERPLWHDDTRMWFSLRRRLLGPTRYGRRPLLSVRTTGGASSVGDLLIRRALPRQFHRSLCPNGGERGDGRPSPHGAARGRACPLNRRCGAPWALLNALGADQTGFMDGESEKFLWTQSFPMAEPMNEALGRIVEERRDDAETEYYEDLSDLTFVTVETSQRRYRGMVNRRIRHMRNRQRGG